MATRHGRPKPFVRLRCDALEPRLAPAADPVIDFGAGFTAAGLPGGLPAGYADGDLLLTDGPFQARAVWAPTPVDLRSFQTSFVFRLGGEPGRLGDGLTFALAGAAPAGPGTAGGGLGYAGITDSVAIKFDLVDNAGEGVQSVGLFTGGAEPTTPAVSLDGTPVNLRSQYPIRADVVYNGATQTLILTLTDTLLTNRIWTHEFVVDIPAAVGSSTGYAGFTAGTGELFARQAIDSWTFTEGTPVVPGNPPAGPVNFGDGFAGADLAGNGSAQVAGDRLRLADAPFQNGSAYAPAPVDVGGFTTSFRFQVGDAPSWWVGDGLTFVLQNAGPAAVGAAGGGLGYQGLTDSVAVKFDLVDNAGEGTDSIGVFTNGAEPTTPADRLPPGGNGAIHLNSGHVFQVNLAYADGTLRVELFDTEAGQGFRRSYAVDVPAAVGGPTAYVGFTAGTGSLFAPIDVLDWTYAPTPAGDPVIAVSAAVGAATGVITTVAGDGMEAYGGDGGPAASALLARPFGVAVDAAGNLFIADTSNQRIRRVDAVTGAITTVAGDGTPGYGGDLGPATGASFAYPAGVAVDAAGDIFIADTNNHRVRRVDAVTGIITTVAGNGAGEYAGNGGPATSVSLAYPEGVAVDAAGNLFIADFGSEVRRVDAVTGIITTVAGNGRYGYGGDGGPAASATLNGPTGVAVDAAGNLFIADFSNSRVRRVDAVTGVITTVAGNGTPGYGGDGGPATSASLFNPHGLAVDAAGNILVTDFGNQRVRRVDAATGVITTVAGTGSYGQAGDGGPATSASLAYPAGVAADAAGNVFIADLENNRIRKLAPAVRAGEPATYTFVIRNTSRASAGPVTVTSVVDSLLGDLTAAARAANGDADIVLAPGASFAFSATGPALNAGPVADTVTATAHDDEGTNVTGSNTVTVTVY